MNSMKNCYVTIYISESMSIILLKNIAYNNRPRKYCSITKSGKKLLNKNKQEWNLFSFTVIIIITFLILRIFISTFKQKNSVL